MDIEFSLDGATVSCPDGLTVAAALHYLRGRNASVTSRAGLRRSVFCGMGVCFDCTMEIDGRPTVRACMTLVRPGMRVITQRGGADVGRRA